MNDVIQIVDRGRGPQLSTSRITVQDLVPYLQLGCTHAEILEIMPVLTLEDIQAVEQYVRDHCKAVMEQDRRIRERTAAQRQPESEEVERQERLKRLEQAREQIRQERNGDHPSG